jgi:tetratricopeptide (TPR) repeat protein
VPHARLRNGSYIDGVIDLAVQLAEALAFLHERSVCHRDLKPSNVLLDPSGKPLLLDFNLSTSEREKNVPKGGTLRYMAPEQIHVFLKSQAKELDERADLFSLGLIVYELLAGDHAYGPIPSKLTGEALGQFLLERMTHGFRPLGEVCTDLERPVAAVLDRCLAIDPADRPTSAAELATELKRQFSPPRQLRRWAIARPRTTLAALLLLTFTLVATGVVWAVTPSYAEREYQRGETAYRAGNYDEAEKHFDLAVQADPKNPNFRRARGCAGLKQSKYLSSENGLEDKLDQVWKDLKPQEGPLDIPSLAVRAYVQSRSQAPDLAIRKYKKIERADYRPLMMRNNRAYCYIQLREHKKARTDLNFAAQLDPNCQAVFYNRAMLALSESHNQKISIPARALDDMERALWLGPVTPALTYDAASLYAEAALDERRLADAYWDAPLVTVLHLGTSQPWVERSRSYLRQAVADGQSVNEADADLFRDALGTFLDFGNLRKDQSHPTVPAMDLHLIEPIDLDN